MPNINLENYLLSQGDQAALEAAQRNAAMRQALAGRLESDLMRSTVPPLSVPVVEQPRNLDIPTLPPPPPSPSFTPAVPRGAEALLVFAGGGTAPEQPQITPEAFGDRPAFSPGVFGGLPPFKLGEGPVVGPRFDENGAGVPFRLEVPIPPPPGKQNPFQLIPPAKGDLFREPQVPLRKPRDPFWEGPILGLGPPARVRPKDPNTLPFENLELKNETHQKTILDHSRLDALRRAESPAAQEKTIGELGLDSRPYDDRADAAWRSLQSNRSKGLIPSPEVDALQREIFPWAFSDKGEFKFLDEPRDQTRTLPKSAPLLNLGPRGKDLLPPTIRPPQLGPESLRMPGQPRRSAPKSDTRSPDITPRKGLPRSPRGMPRPKSFAQNFQEAIDTAVNKIVPPWIKALSDAVGTKQANGKAAPEKKAAQEAKVNN